MLSFRIVEQEAGIVGSFSAMQCSAAAAEGSGLGGAGSKAPGMRCGIKVCLHDKDKNVRSVRSIQQGQHNRLMGRYRVLGVRWGA